MSQPYSTSKTHPYNKEKDAITAAASQARNQVLEFPSLRAPPVTNGSPGYGAVPLLRVVFDGAVGVDRIGVVVVLLAGAGVRDGAVDGAVVVLRGPGGYVKRPGMS